MQSQLKRLQNFDAEDEAQLSADRVTAKVGAGLVILLFAVSMWMAHR